MTVMTSRTEDVIGPRLSGLPSVSLDELTEQAELQTRVDRKYLVTIPVLAAMLDALSGSDAGGGANGGPGGSGGGRGGVAALEIDGRRRFHYASQYFDTADLLCFREHRQGRRRRFKVRTRTYTDSGECMLEVKAVSPRGQTVKERMPYAADDADRLTADATRFAADILEGNPAVARLVPTVATTYHRTTLLDLAARSRLTIDTDLGFVGPAAAVGAPPGTAIVETKTSGRPGRADLALHRLGVRPVSVSKYCIGVALLHPTVPANRWNRVLHRHFGAGRL